MSDFPSRRLLIQSGGAALFVAGRTQPEPPPPMPQPRPLRITNAKCLQLVAGARKIGPIEHAVFRKGLADPIAVSFWTTWDWNIRFQLEGNGFVLVMCTLTLPVEHRAKLNVVVSKALNEARKVVGAPRFQSAKSGRKLWPGSIASGTKSKRAGLCLKANSTRKPSNPIRKCTSVREV